jgi:hypothetical protein
MMRFVGRAILVVLAVAIVALTALRVLGLPPKDRRPGLWLPGTLVEAPVDDWSFTDAVPEIYVETRTRYIVPHSVTIQCAQVGGQLYIASFHFGGPRRSWNQNIDRDPRVRLSIGGRLYDKRAVPLTDPAEIEGVFQAYAKKYDTWKRVSEQPPAERPQIFYWRIEPAQVRSAGLGWRTSAIAGVDPGAETLAHRRLAAAGIGDDLIAMDDPQGRVESLGHILRIRP